MASRNKQPPSELLSHLPRAGQGTRNHLRGVYLDHFNMCVEEGCAEEAAGESRRLRPPCTHAPIRWAFAAHRVATEKGHEQLVMSGSL
jgi:hypothetical protein